MYGGVETSLAPSNLPPDLPLLSTGGREGMFLLHHPNQKEKIMEPIKKYKIVEGKKEGCFTGYHLEPEISDISVYGKNELIFTLEEVAKACNIAYTQAVIDMLNGDLKLPKME